MYTAVLGGVLNLELVKKLLVVVVGGCCWWLLLEGTDNIQICIKSAFIGVGCCWLLLVVVVGCWLLLRSSEYGTRTRIRYLGTTCST